MRVRISPPTALLACAMVAAIACAGAPRQRSQLTGHYAVDKEIFFPKGRNAALEQLYESALREGVKPDTDRAHLTGLSDEEQLAIEYDAAWFILESLGEGHDKLGVLLGRVGRWSEAARMLRVAVKSSYPTAAGTWGNLGVATHALSLYDESTAAFANAAAVEPGYFVGHLLQRRVQQASVERRRVTPE